MPGTFELHRWTASVISFSIVATVAVGAHAVAPGEARRDASDVVPAPDVATVTLDVDRDDLTAALPLDSSPDSAWAVSPVVASDAVMVGLTWPKRAPVAMQVRSRSADGDWTGWTEVHAGAHGPDGAEAPTSSDPVWLGTGTTAVQFRVMAGRIEGVRAAFITDEGADATPPAAAGSLAAEHASSASLTTVTGQVIRRRSQWNTADCRAPGAKVWHSKVKFASVHHTAGTNAYSRTDVPALIRGICSYHVYTQGWSDIGYNFLVDKFGRVWEGRKGRAEFPVGGAHSMGFNSWSSGFALMGDHGATQPTTAALTALEKTIAWKLWIERVPARGTVVVESYGSYKWPEGAMVTLDRISGHRDVQSTSCPGDLAYDDLTSIRNRVAAKKKKLPPRPKPKRSQFMTWDKGDNFVTWHRKGRRGPLRTYDLAADWDIAAATDHDGDGNDELLLYRRKTGRAKLHELKAGGALGRLIHSEVWGKSIIAIATPDRDGDGDDELLVYRRNGSATLFETESTGARGAVVRDYGPGDGWKSIVAGDVDGDGDDELLVHRKGGRLVIREVNPGGRLGETVNSKGIGRSWKSIATPDIDGDGDDELLRYKAGGGAVLLHELNVKGPLGRRLPAKDLPLHRDYVVGVELS